MHSNERLVVNYSIRVRGSCPTGGRSQTAVWGSNYGHIPLLSHSAHSCVVYSPTNFPSTPKLSYLACSICEYLKALPEETNEAGISPSREEVECPGSRRAFAWKHNTSQKQTERLWLCRCITRTTITPLHIVTASARFEETVSGKWVKRMNAIQICNQLAQTSGNCLNHLSGGRGHE